MAHLTISDFVGHTGHPNQLPLFGQHVNAVLGSVARTDHPWDIPGGWEGWFQIEFATYLTMNNIDHERENQIQYRNPTTGRLAWMTPDFLFSNGGYCAPIEIKCYHPGGNITQEALSDVTKLQNSGAPAWLVIAVTPHGAPNGNFIHVCILNGTVGGVNPPNMEIYYCWQ